MEGRAVVEAGASQVREILHGERRIGCKQLTHDLAALGLEARGICLRQVKLTRRRQRSVRHSNLQCEVERSDASRPRAGAAPRRSVLDVDQQAAWPGEGLRADAAAPIQA